MVLFRLSNVKPRRLVVERVGVIEFFRQPPGQRRRIGHADSVNRFEQGKLRQRHLQAEQLLREQRYQSAQPNWRSATGAAWRFPIQSLRWPGAFSAADITG